MTQNKPPREFWMDTVNLESALQRCDLGDGKTAIVRAHPHIETLPHLTKVREVTPSSESELEELKKDKERLEWIANNESIIHKFIDKTWCCDVNGINHGFFKTFRESIDIEMEERAAPLKKTNA